MFYTVYIHCIIVFGKRWRRRNGLAPTWIQLTNKLMEPQKTHWGNVCATIESRLFTYSYILILFMIIFGVNVNKSVAKNTKEHCKLCWCIITTPDKSQ